MDIQYLKMLARNFPTVQSVSTEIINLSAICNLPKGTEHFMSDLHGEHKAFLHIMNTCSGVIREKIDVAFGNTLTVDDKNELAALIYYPQQTLETIKSQCSDMNDKYAVLLTRLVEVCHAVTHKYSRSKVRKALTLDFAYIIDELLNTNYVDSDRESYYENIILTIIQLGRSEAFIVAIVNLIKRMAVDTLHIVGDIFDRGPHADVIINRLMQHHSVDIEWGNHDILWMGAAASAPICVAAVVKNCLQYNNLDMLENSYGISLMPLAMFATEHYGDAEVFSPRVEPIHGYISSDDGLYAKMHKAICVIMFKLEGQLIARNPEFGMGERDMLSRIDYKNKTVNVGGKDYELRDGVFPTVDPNDPNALTDKEQLLIEQLASEFANSTHLQEHVKYLYRVGSFYRVCNNNLLYHGCVPTDESGEFMRFTFCGNEYYGKTLFDYADSVARSAYTAPKNSELRRYSGDFLWYLWCGKDSPLFGRTQMTTFERTLITDEATWVEPKNAYYKHYNDEKYCEKILNEFGVVDNFSHIINGHIPVKAKQGEEPRRANGRLIVIDGGFCKAYQKTTGIAGYTMFFSSHGLRIASHEPYSEDNDKVNVINADIRSKRVIVDNAPKRIMVADTDIGKLLKEQIAVYNELLQAYRSGLIDEKRS